jgi:hypothetical protein
MERGDINSAEDILAGSSGELAERIRRKDWSQTPLGPIEIIWGPSRIQIYNDGYRPLVIRTPDVTISPVSTASRREQRRCP